METDAEREARHIRLQLEAEQRAAKEARQYDPKDYEKGGKYYQVGRRKPNTLKTFIQLLQPDPPFDQVFPLYWIGWAELSVISVSVYIDREEFETQHYGMDKFGSKDHPYRGQVFLINGEELEVGEHTFGLLMRCANNKTFTSNEVTIIR